MEYQYYVLEYYDNDYGRMRRDSAQWKSEGELHDNMGEIIKASDGNWRVIEIVHKETVVTRGERVVE